MAITAADFVTKFPEFGTINTESPDLVQRALDDAAGQLSSKVWGHLYTQGVYYLAAHLLATGPFGEFARLQDAEPKQNGYWQAYRMLLRRLPIRGMVI